VVVVQVVEELHHHEEIGNVFVLMDSGLVLELTQSAVVLLK